MPLPITAILPTRNCRNELERHLREMERAWSAFSQIVVIDSESTDGTFELLRECFEKIPHASVVSRPPGLYESWNHACSLASQEWTYFSTVGDILDAEKLPAFFEAARRLDCDVLISPPAMVEKDGRTPSAISWPIHRLVAKSSSSQPAMLSPEQTILGLFSFITGSLMGSSASNLYRTEFLQKHPFPHEFGHAGDTAWGLRYGPEIRMGLYPKCIATFALGWEFQGHDARLQKDAFLKLSEEGTKSLSQAMTRGQDVQFLAGWFAAMTASKEALWNWLADQASLAEDHHKLVALMKEMELELNRRWPERIYRTVCRILGKKL